MCTRAGVSVLSGALILPRMPSRTSRSSISAFSRTSPNSVAARTSVETCSVSDQQVQLAGSRSLLIVVAVHIVADNSTKQTAEHHRHSTKAIVSS